MNQPQSVPYRALALRDITQSMASSLRRLEGSWSTPAIFKLDPDRLSAASNLYAKSIEPSAITSIVMGGELSAIAHLMIGLGNFSILGHNATSTLSVTTYSDPYFKPSRPCIRQDGDRESDYHPWQTFAYLSLAGTNPDAAIDCLDNLPLRQLAINSPDIVMSRGLDDLGHLLIAAAFLVPDRQFQISINSIRWRLEELVNQVVRIHSKDERRHGTCFDFHLTEGLCLAVSRIPGLGHLREHVGQILNEQLKVLFYVSGFSCTMGHLFGQKAEDADNPDLFIGLKSHEPIPVLIGHALELAAVAQLCGFELSPSQKNAVAYVANGASAWFLGGYHSDFAVMAHWRRAFTLLLEIDKANSEGRPLSSIDLSAYSVRF